MSRHVRETSLCHACESVDVIKISTEPLIAPLMLLQQCFTTIVLRFESWVWDRKLDPSLGRDVLRCPSDRHTTPAGPWVPPKGLLTSVCVCI